MQCSVGTSCSGIGFTFKKIALGGYRLQKFDANGEPSRKPRHVTDIKEKTSLTGAILCVTHVRSTLLYVKCTFPDPAGATQFPLGCQLLPALHTH